MKNQRRLKKVYQYTAVFEPDSESGGYTVSIPALPGCLSEGDTFEEAQRNIKEAALLYLETIKQERAVAPIEAGIIFSPIYLNS